MMAAQLRGRMALAAAILLGVVQGVDLLADVAAPHKVPSAAAQLQEPRDTFAVQSAKRDVDIAKAEAVTAEVTSLANKQIANQDGAKAAKDKTAAHHYKEKYFKEKGRASADKAMYSRLERMKAKEGKTKHASHGLQGKEIRGKHEVAKHEKALVQIRKATKMAFNKAAKAGAPQLSIDKLKTKEKVEKIGNKKITKEMRHDEHAVDDIHHGNAKPQSKKQKLHAMKGVVKGFLFLKALDKKATGALNTVNELKKTLAKRRLKKELSKQKHGEGQDDLIELVY